jgi:hypothetical protein
MGLDSKGLIWYGYIFPLFTPWGDQGGSSAEECDADRYSRLRQCSFNTAADILEDMAVHDVCYGSNSETTMMRSGVAVRASEHECGMHTPVTFSPHAFDVDPAWHEQLDTYCEIMGLDVRDRVPAWHMGSYRC